MSSIMPHNQQAVEQPKRDCRHNEEIHRRDPVGMIMKERLPSSRWWPSTLGHRLGNACLTDIDADLEKLAVDARLPPEWIGDAHRADQLSYFERHRRPATTASRLPAPVQPETRAMPAN